MIGAVLRASCQGPLVFYISIWLLCPKQRHCDNLAVKNIFFPKWDVNSISISLTGKKKWDDKWDSH